MAKALYIHIPFCASKCPYCAFVSVAHQHEIIEPYVAALRTELTWQAVSAETPLATLYIGGGTPTLLPVKHMCEVLDDCRRLYGVDADTEITVEANPGSVSGDSLRQLRSLGVNRLSLGVQSLQKEELATLGRQHSVRMAVEAFALARQAGFTNISVDLMTGIPGQTVETWDKTLQSVLSWQPDHCSIYELTLEENTPLHAAVGKHKVSLPDEESRLGMDTLSIGRTAASGLLRYEIANFARSKKKCRHNLIYWRNEEYIGIGAGAVSCIAGLRERRTPDVVGYIEGVRQQNVVCERERLDREASFRESVVIGLRLTLGVSRSRLWQRYGIDLLSYYGHTLEGLLAAGMVRLVGDQLRLTAFGRPIANQVLCALV